MKELLEEWAEREPERCQRYEDGSYWLMFGDWNYSPDSPGALQEAVQQAIEARGWDWDTGTSQEPTYRVWHGSILTDPVINIWSPREWSNDSSAHALLSAYLQELKAEAAA
jgi:hypothetical protein